MLENLSSSLHSFFLNILSPLVLSVRLAGLGLPFSRLMDEEMGAEFIFVPKALVAYYLSLEEACVGVCVCTFVRLHG